MKHEVIVQGFEDACKKARKAKFRQDQICPLYPDSICCQEECNVPKFARWVLGYALKPEDADPYE